MMAADQGLGWALLGAGVATQVIALLLLRRPLRLLRSGGKTRGVVVANEESMHASTGGRPSLFFFPVVEFTTREGRSIRFTSDTGRRVAPPKGSSVRVLYDPNQPYDASLATFSALWMFPLVTSAFGMPFVVAGLVALL